MGHFTQMWPCQLKQNVEKTSCMYLLSPRLIFSFNVSNLSMALTFSKTLGQASLVAQRLKHLPGMLEAQVQSLGWEDPLEKEMATHSSTLAWRIPWREEPGRLQSMGSQSRTRLSDFTHSLKTLGQDGFIMTFTSNTLISLQCAMVVKS